MVTVRLRLGLPIIDVSAITEDPNAVLAPDIII